MAEALLFATGAINRQGRVDDGSTVSDFEPEEIKYHMSLSLALAPCQVGEVKLNIIDTPGYADFFGEVRAACSVVDLVVVVVGVPSKVSRRRPRPPGRWPESWDFHASFFVNKLDRDQASFTARWPPSVSASVPALRRWNCRWTGESGFHGIADLLTDTAIIYEGGKPTSGPIPERPGRDRAPGPRAVGRGNRGR